MIAKKSIGLAVMLLSVLLCPAKIWAQAQVANGIIEGLVTDATGAVVPSVEIEIRNKDTGFTRNLVSNEAGRYTALLLPVGTYEVTAQLGGFATVKVADVLIQVGQQRVVDITMKVSGLTETVNVSSDEVPLVDTARATSSSVLDDRAVHDLPSLERNFQNFLLLTPGTLLVNPTGTEANFSIGGQKGINAAFSLDGAEYTNSFFAGQTGGDRPPFTVSLEAVQEFVVQTNGFNAEFGRSGGGMMNAVTKSGTNQIRGNAFWFFQDKSFVHNDAFGRSPLGHRQQFGATIGGPIKKDKLFFFAASDNQRRSSPINLVFNGQDVLQLAANSSDPNRRAAATTILSRQQQIQAGDNVWSLLGKVDWVINNKNNFSTRYNVSRNEQPNGSYGLLPQQARDLSDFGLEKNTVDSFNGQLSTIFSQKAVNEFRVNITREDRPRLDYPIPGATSVNGVSGGAQVSITGVGSIGPPAFLPIVTTEWRYQGTDNFSYAFGKHNLKFGADFNQISVYDLYRGNARGLFTFFSFDSFVAKQPDQFIQFFGPGAVTMRPMYMAAFVQDTFKVKPGLSIDYGLRWEGQRNQQGDLPNADFLQQTKNVPNDLKQWSPRLGIAWDPSNNGKQVIRLFGGYLYAPTPNLILDYVLRYNGDITNGIQYFVDRGTNAAAMPAFNNPYGGPYPTPYNAFPGVVTRPQGTVPGANVNIIDQNFHNPRIFRANAAYEQQVLRDWTLTATYDYAFTTGNERMRDINLFPGKTDPVTGRTIYDRTQRPYPFAGQVASRESSVSARYEALILSAKKRFSKRFQLQTYYNYGRNFSEDDNENGCCSNEGYDQQNLRLDWGRSRLDIRHNFVLSGVFSLPFGIQMSPIVSAQSGRPYNATTGTDSPTAYQLSPAALANFRSFIGDPNAIVYGGGNGDATAGTDRPIVNGKLLPRNAFEQPIVFRTDLRVSKQFRLSEKHQVQALADFFNLFNNDNKFTTNMTISTPSFGSLNNAGDPFAVQLGVRYNW